MSSKTFFYFAYGSNMLTKRIHINNPTAVFRWIGCLTDHRLDFNAISEKWKGASATIVPSRNSDVWGVIWEIDNSNMPCLDNQEGVQQNIYFPKTVRIHTAQGQNIQCRTYQQCKIPENYIDPILLPAERKPSLLYLTVILNGAKEFHLPEKYIEFLNSFPHNGYTNVDDEILLGIEKIQP